MGVIQACMNYDELFCYFINLLQHFSKKKHWNCEDRIFMKKLKKCGFFKNLTESNNDKYIKLIKEIYIKSGDDNTHKIQKIINKIMYIH